VCEGGVTGSGAKGEGPSGCGEGHDSLGSQEQQVCSQDPCQQPAAGARLTAQAGGGRYWGRWGRYTSGARLPGKWEHCRLDGTTSKEEREEVIREFNAPGSETFIFLLSIRAGAGDQPADGRHCHLL